MLTGGGEIASNSFGAGRGGTVTVAATDTIAIAVRFSEGVQSGLFSATEGSGQGGALHIAAPHLQLSDGGNITATSSDTGDAGTIRLQVGETFQSQNGSVTTATEGAGGRAIALTAGRLVQLIDSELTTTVRGGGETLVTSPSIPSLSFLRAAGSSPTPSKGEGAIFASKPGCFWPILTVVWRLPRRWGSRGQLIFARR
jgi:hypothetical protein